MHDDDDDNQPNVLFDKYYNLNLGIRGGLTPATSN